MGEPQLHLDLRIPMEIGLNHKGTGDGRSYYRRYYVLAVLRGKFRWQKGEDLMPRKIPDERVGPPTEIGMQILASSKKLQYGLNSDSS